MFWWLVTKRMFSEYTLLIAIPWMGNLHIMIICLNNGNILDRDIFILGQILITTRLRIKMHWYFDSIVLWGLLGQKHRHIFIFTSCWHIRLQNRTLAFFAYIFCNCLLNFWAANSFNIWRPSHLFYHKLLAHSSALQDTCLFCLFTLCYCVFDFWGL